MPSLPDTCLALPLVFLSCLFLGGGGPLVFLGGLFWGGRNIPLLPGRPESFSSSQQNMTGLLLFGVEMSSFSRPHREPTSLLLSPSSLSYVWGGSIPCVYSPSPAALGGAHKTVVYLQYCGRNILIYPSQAAMSLSKKKKKRLLRNGIFTSYLQSCTCVYVWLSLERE